MNVIDIVIGIPLLWAVYNGFKKGLIVEVSSLVALVLGIYGAIHFSDFTADFIRNNFDYDSQYMGYIAFAITFLLIVIGVNLLGKLLSKLADAIALGVVNKILGVLFSLLKWVIVLSIVVFFVDYVNKKKEFIPKEMQEKSILYQPMLDISEQLFDWFNSDFSKASKKIKESLNDSPVKV